MPYLYPTLREKCRQASFRWASKFARRKFPPHSGQTWGGRFLCIRWWALKLQRLDMIMGHVVQTWGEKSIERGSAWHIHMCTKGLLSLFHRWMG